jgi:hypothetical protein
MGPGYGPFSLCAEHVRQFEGESPFDNLIELNSLLADQSINPPAGG